MQQKKQQVGEELNGGKFPILFWFLPLCFQHRYNLTLLHLWISCVAGYIPLFYTPKYMFSWSTSRYLVEAIVHIRGAAFQGHFCSLLKRRLVRCPRGIKSIHLTVRMNRNQFQMTTLTLYMSCVHAFIILSGGDQCASEWFSLLWTELNLLWTFTTCSAHLGKYSP